MLRRKIPQRRERSSEREDENQGRHHTSRDGSLRKENVVNYMLKSKWEDDYVRDALGWGGILWCLDNI